MGSSEIEITETPKWLQQLEEKREKRLRTKLGHELGAGAPCLTCQDTCPGLDLHFWRKICKNCKCSKEAHEVQDDDIYGWAQDELLGTRTKRLRQKIIIPGRKDEVELEWTPNGQKEIIEKYIKTLPVELLPIKGTQAAQDRKLLLKKQIPVHDIDPTLCHELSNEELTKMQEYIGHVKENSAGVGTLITVNHDATMFYINNIPKSLSNSTRIPGQHCSVSTPLKTLTKNLDNLILTEDAPIKYLSETSNVEGSNANFTGNLPNNNYFEPIKDERFNPIRNLSELAYSTFETTPSELIADKSRFGHQTNESLANLKSYAAGIPSNISEENQTPTPVKIGGIRDLQHETFNTTLPEGTRDVFPGFHEPQQKLQERSSCRYCEKNFEPDELAIAIPDRSNSVYHTGCFKCHGCNQILADMFYFYDKDSDEIYCGRDYAKIRGIPRCKACDELIFLKEYCLAENCTFHVKHFCCFECDEPLAGQNYVMENEQPVCIPCFESTKANLCYACKNVIRPDQQGLELKPNVHFHATEQCFACKICKKSLFGTKLLFRNDRLYCSHECFNSDVPNL